MCKTIWDGSLPPWTFFIQVSQSQVIIWLTNRINLTRTIPISNIDNLKQSRRQLIFNLLPESCGEDQNIEGQHKTLAWPEQPNCRVGSKVRLEISRACVLCQCLLRGVLGGIPRGTTDIPSILFEWRSRASQEKSCRRRLILFLCCFRPG